MIIIFCPKCAKEHDDIKNCSSCNYILTKLCMDCMCVLSDKVHDKTNCVSDNQNKKVWCVLYDNMIYKYNIQKNVYVFYLIYNTISNHNKINNIQKKMKYETYDLASIKNNYTLDEVEILSQKPGLYIIQNKPLILQSKNDYMNGLKKIYSDLDKKL